MVLAALALLVLISGLAARRLSLSPRLRRKLVLVGTGTVLTVLLLSGLRLTPLALLALLLGAGFAGNLIMRELGSRGGFEGGAGEGEAPPRRAFGMDREEALAILGLKGSPAPAEIQAAHKRMILRAHPDQGGSDYLAAKVNEARRVLLPGD